MITVTNENREEVLNTLKEELRNSTAKFTYLKKDGSARSAWGTLNEQAIAKYNATPTGKGWGYSDEAAATTTRYYDLNSNGWRAFTNDNLQTIEDDK